MKRLISIFLAALVCTAFLARVAPVSAQVAGNCLRFDGTNDYVKVGPVDLQLTDQLTVNAWIMWLKTPGAPPFRQFTTLVCNNDSMTDDHAEFWLQHDNMNTYFQWALALDDGSQNTVLVNSTTSPVRNVWYMVTGTYDGTWVRLYVNGILETSLNYPAVFQPFDLKMILTFGGSAKNSNFYRRFFGLMDEVSVLNRCLDAGEVGWFYQCGVNGDDPSVQAYYAMNEPAGFVVTDSSTYGRNGTNIGRADIVVSTVPLLDCVLPVQSLYFRAIEMGLAGVRLEWATASETNNDYFTLRKSTNAIDWEIIAIVDGAGNSNSVREYHFNDNSPSSGTVYYSLLQTDYNGYIENLGTLSVGDNSNVIDVGLYPNPAINGQLMLDYGNSIDEGAIVDIQIYDVLGSLISSQSAVTSSGSPIAIDLSGMAGGMYFIKATSTGTGIYSGSFIIR